MGTKLKDLAVKKEIAIADLKDRKLVVDSYNIMYQFLSTIRMYDGSPLKDSHGNITSHLTGLFSRTTNLMQQGLKLAFVFDGTPPKLKEAERERRKEAKLKAEADYEIAKEREDFEEMKKYAARTSRLTPDMVEEAKKLVAALGLPVIEAPSEGEAQAARMVNQGDAFAEISQDYDCLMFGVKRVVRNLTVSEKRKLPSKAAYQSVSPEIIELKETLQHLGISQEQLVLLCILIGTDYNVGGIPGIGPKKALKMVQDYKGRQEEMFKDARWGDHFETGWKEIMETIQNIPTTDEYAIAWKRVDDDAVVKLLCDRHDFSEERIRAVLGKMDESAKQRQQKGLGDFVS
ncbi:flap endonuclease-1 [Candidatus Woesearchaeota archaeon]|nr:flap endonuclease-1 [Candidatus Woesearchaeota archaeon]